MEFEHVTYAVDVDVHDVGIRDIGTAMLGMAKPKETRHRAVLKNISGVLSPGTMTLVRRLLSCLV